MSKTRQIRLILVRSGRTTWDEDGRLCGSTDLPLCPACSAGLPDRATAVAETGESIDVILCGPDEATRATAAAIAETTGGVVKSVDRLAELTFGLWEGSLRTDLEERNPTVFRRWEEDPVSVTPPQGETLEDAAARLLPALTKAIGKQKLPGGSVVVVLRPYAWAVVEAMASGRGFGAVVDILDQEGAISTRVTDLATLSELPMSLGLAH